jgi:hypothetical protein
LGGAEEDHEKFRFDSQCSEQDFNGHLLNKDLKHFHFSQLAWWSIGVAFVLQQETF